MKTDCLVDDLEFEKIPDMSGTLAAIYVNQGYAARLALLDHVLSP